MVSYLNTFVLWEFFVVFEVTHRELFKKETNNKIIIKNTETKVQ